MPEVAPPSLVDKSLSLSQRLLPRLRSHTEISSPTPVLDNIDGLSSFIDEAIELVRQGHNVDVFVIGRSGDGKSAISEQIIQKQQTSSSKIMLRYYNTSMAIETARQQHVITSPFGRFTKAEYNDLSNFIIVPKLQATEKTEDGVAKLRLLEFPSVEDGINLGNSALRYSNERARRDTNYRRRVVAVIAERKLHRRNNRMREAIWHVRSIKGLQRVFKRYNIVPDSADIHPFDMRVRMGHPRVTNRMDKDITNQLLTKQGEIRLRGIDKSLPILTVSALKKDSVLEERAIGDLYRLRADDVGLDRNDIFIAMNRLIRRKIPYYGNMRNDPALRL